MWSSQWRVVVCVVAAAAMVRVPLAVFVQAEVDRRPGSVCLIGGDAEGYWELAGRMSRGESFAVHDPPRFLLRMPGFPAFLAVCRLVGGESLLFARICLAIVGAIVCGGICLFAQFLANARSSYVGLFAGGIAAVAPLLAGMSALILSENFFSLFLLLSIASGVLLDRLCGGAATDGTDGTPQSRRCCSSSAIVWCAIGCGIFTAGGALVRPTWILFPVWIVALLLTNRGAFRPRCLALGLFTVAFLLTMSPWWVRNFAVTGRFVPTTLWMGPSLYDGLNPDADGTSNMQFVETDGLYRTLSEYDVDQHYRREAWKFAWNEPGRALALGWVKLGRFWSPWPNFGRFQTAAVQWVCLVWFVVAYVGAGLGLVKMWRQPRIWLSLLLPLLYFSALHVLFVGSVRYRVPAEVPLLVLTGIGWAAMLPFPKSRQPSTG